MEAKTNACPACGAITVGASKYCSACGIPLDATATRAGPQPLKWYYNIWFVLLMLFFVLGPFGLPLVWKHPRFSRGLKWGLTVLTLAYTLWLIDATIRVTQAVLERVNQFNETLQF
jgi:hypothetical protein